MEEIKFRAWNEEFKEMVYFDFWGIDDDCCFAGKHLIHNLSEVPVMLYIGEEDSKGQAIYEGDIIKNIHGAERKVIEIDSIAGGCEPFIELAGAGWQSANGEDCEVIGNIYEHKHLLSTEGI